MDHPQRTGSVAERSKALVLGTSLFGGVGSNPTAAIPFFSKSLPWGKKSMEKKELTVTKTRHSYLAQWPSGKASVS